MNSTNKPKPAPPKKKASKPRGRPPKDLSSLSGYIPMDPGDFAKIIMNTPPRTLKKK